MSSDLYAFENSILADQFFPFFELHPLPEEIYGYDRPVDLFSSSSHGAELENVSLSQLRNEGEVKMEDFHPSVDDFSALGILPQVFDETVIKSMQRSYSSNSFENSHNFLLRSRFDCVSHSQNPHNHQIQTSSEGRSFSSSGFQFRKVCSTGDLQNVTTNSRPTNSLLASEKPLTTPMDEESSKAKRYTAEERKQRIHRYRAKKTRRNFNKTIKYVCRKTLADNRPRIRGRFVRNDDKASQLLFRYNGGGDDDQIGSDLFCVNTRNIFSRL